MRILVTGGSGYIGRKLVEALKGRAEVSVLNRRPVEGAGFISGDIRDKDLDLSGFDAVYHLAAVSSPRTVETDREAAWDVNVNGTRNIASRLKKGQRMVFMSSAQVYDKRAEKKHVEDEIPLPNNFYGLTKLVGEDILRFQALQNGFSYVALRLFNVYSKDQPPGLLLGDVLEKYRKGGRIEVFNPGALLDMVHMKDLLGVLEGAATMEPGVYNVCSGHAISVSEIYRAIRERVGAKGVEEVVMSDKKDWLLGDNSRLRKLGFSFRKFSLVDE